MMHLSKCAVRACMGLALAFAVSGTAQAEKRLLDCRVNAAVADGGLLQPQYLFEYEEGASQALVNDGLIKQVLGKPLAAKLKDADSRATFSWGYKVPGGGTKLPVVFTATLIKANMMLHVTGRVTGGEYIGDGQAEGKCTYLR